MCGIPSLILIIFVTSAPDAEAKRNRERIAKEARANVSDYVFPKITKVHDGRRLIVDQIPLVYHPPPEEKVPEDMPLMHFRCIAKHCPMNARCCWIVIT